MKPISIGHLPAAVLVCTRKLLLILKLLLGVRWVTFPGWREEIINIPQLPFLQSIVHSMPLEMQFLLVLFASGAPIWALSQISDSVTIVAGTLQGGFCSSPSKASYFLSVPFAEPPVGDLRFASPKAYSRKFSDGTWNATMPAAACIQFGTTFLETSAISEDW